MQFDAPGGPITSEITTAVVAGWTGRDRDAVDHHIAELAELGVAPPSDVPLFYRVSADLLTQGGIIQVLGENTSGEIEPFILRADGRFWLGLASDHTDRALEATSVAASKQVCAKPISASVWPFEDVSPHLDELELRCAIQENGGWTDYQAGTLASILPLAQLIESAALPDDAAMLCGTLPAIGGVRPALEYRMTLTDPVLGRTLGLDYRATTLPTVA